MEILKTLRPGLQRTGQTLCVLLMLGSSARGQQVLGLHEAIRRALAAPAAQVLSAQVDEVRGGVRQAGLRPNPRIYLSSEDLRPWANDFSFPNNTEDYGYFGQVVEVDGKRGRRIDVATARLRQSEAQQAFRLQQISIQVAASYWTAASAESVIALLQRDLSAVDDMVRYNQERVDAGATRGIDLLRIQIERDRIAIALQAAQRDATLARVELLRLTGDPPSTTVRLGDAITVVDPVPPVTLEVAMAQRADVRAAREALTLAQADVRLQRAYGVPDPDVLVGYKRNSGFDTGYASVQVPLPFLNRNQGEVQRARASVTAAQASLQLVQMQVRADVEAAQKYFAEEKQIVERTLPDMRERAQKNLEILTEAYRIGGVDLLRYLDAERTEVDVEVNVLRTLTEYHQAALRLQLAYGVQP